MWVVTPNGMVPQTHTHIVTSTIANQQYDHEVLLEVLVVEVAV